MTQSAFADRLAAGRRARANAPAARLTQSINALERTALLGGMAVLLLLNIALIGLKVGPLPVRAALAVAFLGLATLQYPAAFRHALGRQSGLVWLAILLAALGTFVSLINRAPAPVIIGSLIEVHLQIIVTVLLATMVAHLCGARPVLLTVAAVVGLSALVAFVQFAGAGWAWQIRETLGQIQGQNMAEVKYFLKGRPMGLSFSPIHLGTQLCIAFAAVTITRVGLAPGRKQGAWLDPVVVGAVLFLLVFSAVSGNRSPILGAGIFLAFYASRKGGAMLPAMLLGLAIFAYFLFPVLLDAMQSANLRIAQSADRSALTRVPLVTLGWKLFLDNPLGYGFGFEPFAHWSKYWHEIYTLPGADAVRDRDLHNYPLSMLNTYGIGLLLALPLAVLLLARSKIFLIYFIPYVIHILFHNSGPFWNDTLIWFAIGAASAMKLAQPDDGAPRHFARSLPGQLLLTRQTFTKSLSQRGTMLRP